MIFYPFAERILLCRPLKNASLSGPAIDLQKIPILPKKIIFSDEAHFDIGGYVNKQNCRIWGTEIRTYTLKTRRTQNESLFRGVIGSFFFENEQGEAITVNGDCYLAMLNEFLFTIIKKDDIGNIWFQQDGATCHTAEATLDAERLDFENRIGLLFVGCRQR